MEPQSPLLPIAAKLKRPASIVLTFKNTGAYRQAVHLYCEALDIPAPAEPLGDYCSLPTRDKQMELRLVLVRKDIFDKNRTIVYWEVTDLDRTHQELIRLPGYREEKPPQQDQNFTGQAVATVRSVIEDDSGNLFGLVINPPYPLK